MNKKVMKAGLFLLLGMFLAGAMPVQSSDLYVYTVANGSPQSFSLDVVQKLTFNGSNLVVNKTGGGTESFAFTNLKCFSFRSDLYSQSTDLAPAPETVALSVYPNPAQADIVITGAQTITAVTLCNLQGQQLLERYPASSKATLSLAGYPAGVYLLQVSDETGTVIKKIIKK
jgi:hypothetical protein